MAYGFVFRPPAPGLIIIGEGLIIICEGFIIIIWGARLPPGAMSGMDMAPTRRACACDEGGWASAPNTTGNRASQRGEGRRIAVAPLGRREGCPGDHQCR